MNTKSLTTPSGTIRFPAYVPVTTFGGKYPLDALIQPYLPRLAQVVMVSHHYALQMKERPRLPLMIDSGGFAALFEGIRAVVSCGQARHLTPFPEPITRLEPAVCI